jgi:Fe-S cluster biogenesis protein NfuA
MEKRSSQEILDKVKHAIDSIRPYLVADGGDIMLIEITDDITVKVKLTGACQGCPYSEQTLRAGIEHAIRNELPELKELISIE